MGVLFDLVDAAAGTNLYDFVSLRCGFVSAMQHTTPINSYNMAGMCCLIVCVPAAALSVMSKDCPGSADLI